MSYLNTYLQFENTV